MYLHHQALFHYGEDIELATRFTRIAESLISGHRNEHTLRAKLSNCICSITSFVEPSQALTERCLKGYNSARIVGDIDSAMLSSLLYCLTYIYCLPDLVSAQKKVEHFLHLSVSSICIRIHQLQLAFLTFFLPTQTRSSTGDYAG
jgi:hypothetical protein